MMTELRPLTASQRYWQAVKKARLIGERDRRRFLAGEIGYLPMIDERRAIIAEMDRIIKAVQPSSSGGET